MATTCSTDTPSYPVVPKFLLPQENPPWPWWFFPAVTGDKTWFSRILLGGHVISTTFEWNGSRKTQPSLTKVTAAESPGCFLFLEEGKPTNFHDGSMDKMVFVSPQHLAKSDGFSCRFEKTPFFHGNPSWGKKKKNTKKYHQIFTAEARGTAFSDSKGSNFPVRP